MDSSLTDFKDRAAIVTGGGSGIGAACVALLAGRGARVLVADIDLDAAARVAARVGAAAVPHRVDVSDPVACEAMVSAAVSAFGRLDVAVNNAGVGGPPAPTGRYPLDGWASVLGVNLNGVFYCMRVQIPAMLATGGGSIVNMSSVLGAAATPNTVPYVAAKHGVVGLTRAAAIEYAAQGIRVNCVGPGFIDTPLLAGEPPALRAALSDLHPSGRLGRAEEVAELVAFLASDKASNTTGAFMLTDGGYLAR
jgi:NAD(P)-dependent dehydrogenase (short-subunit alcohol dehydrogenase family)